MSVITSMKLKVPFDMDFYHELDMPTANLIVRNGKFKERGLSDTDKLNCYSWGIPREYCKTGSKLAMEDPDSICAKCSTKKGHYTIPDVANVYQQRYDAWIQQEHWIEAITFLIKNSGYDNFRWFDNGDIQDEYMLLQFIKVAEMLPKKKFWIPTQEHDIVFNVIDQGYEIPKNMTIRLSTRKRFTEPPTDKAKRFNDYPNVKGYIGTSSTVNKDDFNEFNGFKCPSSKQGNKCLDCEACWQRIPNIPYKFKP